MMKTVEEALAVIRMETSVLGTIERKPGDACGHVLVTAVLMRGDSPPFDRALLDGFAVRSSDARGGAQLEMVGNQDAGGERWSGTVTAGKCVAINTGGMLPEGADAVLMVEHSETRQDGDTSIVTVQKDVGVEQGVQRRGAHARAGATVLDVGTLLNPAGVAAAVSAGAASVTVWRKARVAVLSTGDELVAAGRELGPGQIHNSNQPMLVGLVGELGNEGMDLGWCGDTPAELRERLERGLSEADVLIVTGGMSMGTRDLVPPLLKELGVEIRVEKVRMKPGKPFVFGTRGSGSERKYVAGLPGNPVSAFVTFQIFVRELLERLDGNPGRSRWVQAEAAGQSEANGDRDFFQPCTLGRRGATVIAEPIDWRGSADILTLSRAEGLVRRAAKAAATVEAELVDVFVI